MTKNPPKAQAPSALKKKCKSVASLWSQEVQNGSPESGQTREASPHHANKGQSQSSEKQMDDFVNYERDWRSHAVKEYDPHQDAARKSKSEALREVVKKAG